MGALGTVLPASIACGASAQVADAAHCRGDPVSAARGSAVADASAGLPTQITLSGTLIVFFLSAFMCLSAGLLATKRLRSVDPADIF